MFPAIVLLAAESEMDEGTPFRPLRFGDQVHLGLVRQLVAFASIARDAGANDIFPSGQAAAVARDDVIEIQVFAVKDSAAVLAGVFVALEDVMPGEFHFFFRQAIEKQQDDDAWDADFKGDGFDHVLLGFALRKLLPTGEIVSEKVVLSVGVHDLGVPLAKEREGATNGADIHRLPETVEDENLAIQHSRSARKVAARPQRVNAPGWCGTRFVKGFPCAGDSIASPGALQ